MKIIERKEWALIKTCPSCKSQLEINANDIRSWRHTDYGGGVDTGYDYTCPVCDLLNAKPIGFVLESDMPALRAKSSVHIYGTLQRDDAGFGDPYPQLPVYLHPLKKLTMKITDANRARGMFIYTFDGRYVFRVPHPDGEFKDYTMLHSDLMVIIDDEDATFYEVDDRASLDHCPDTLGKQSVEAKMKPRKNVEDLKQSHPLLHEGYKTKVRRTLAEYLPNGNYEERFLLDTGLWKLVFDALGNLKSVQHSREGNDGAITWHSVAW